MPHSYLLRKQRETLYVSVNFTTFKCLCEA